MGHKMPQIGHKTTLLGHYSGLNEHIRLGCDLLSAIL
jgi:hypothetical protein